MGRKHEHRVNEGVENIDVRLRFIFAVDVISNSENIKE